MKLVPAIFLRERVAGQALERAAYSRPVSHGQLLLVSADERFIAQLHACLECLAVTIAITSSVRELLPTVLAQRPMLIVLDAALPDDGALSACLQLKGTPTTRDLPVLIVATSASMGLRMQSIEVGADACFSLIDETRALCARTRVLLHLHRHALLSEPVESVVLALAHAVAVKDRLTGKHLTRLGDEALLFGRRLGLDEEQQSTLRYSAMLHDVGKIGIDAQLLHKSEPLTFTERQQIEAHPQIGECIVQPLRLLAHVGPAIRHHHERWDGHGYPDRLRGREIPLLARIVSVLDAFDAMTSWRPYAPARSVAEAREVLRAEAGRQWDPAIVGVFDAWLDDLPLRAQEPAPTPSVGEIHRAL